MVVAADVPGLGEADGAEVLAFASLGAGDGVGFEEATGGLGEGTGFDSDASASSFSFSDIGPKVFDLNLA